MTFKGHGDRTHGVGVEKDAVSAFSRRRLHKGPGQSKAAVGHGKLTLNDRVLRVALKRGSPSASSAETGLPLLSVALTTATGLASQAPEAPTNLPLALLLVKSAAPPGQVQAQLPSRVEASPPA